MASSRASTTASRRRTKATSTRSRGHKPAPQGAKAKAKPKAPPKTRAKAKPKVAAKTGRPQTAKAPPKSFAARAVTAAIVTAIIATGLAAAYLFWFRDSSFVLVEKVVVEGMEGPEADAVTAALTRTGTKMTTLNVDEGELAAAVSRYPTVVSVVAEADFPHGLSIQVESRPPVLNVTDGGPPVPVAADGTLLRGLDGSDASVPTVNVPKLPATGTLAGDPLELARVAGAAPDPLRPLIDDISVGESAAIEVELEGGIPVIFGDSGQAESKWAAVSAVLADPQVKTLTQLDVRVPERPAIGGAAPSPGEG